MIEVRTFLSISAYEFYVTPFQVFICIGSYILEMCIINYYTYSFKATTKYKIKERFYEELKRD